MTKLGRLVQDKKIKNIEQIYAHALPVKESQIIDHFFGFGVLAGLLLLVTKHKSHVKNSFPIS